MLGFRGQLMPAIAPCFSIAGATFCRNLGGDIRPVTDSDQTANRHNKPRTGAIGQLELTFYYVALNGRFDAAEDSANMARERDYQ
jgi:hypothetical protein